MSSHVGDLALLKQRCIVMWRGNTDHEHCTTISGELGAKLQSADFFLIDQRTSQRPPWNLTDPTVREWMHLRKAAKHLAGLNIIKTQFQILSGHILVSQPRYTLDDQRWPERHLTQNQVLNCGWRLLIWDSNRDLEVHLHHLPRKKLKQRTVRKTARRTARNHTIYVVIIKHHLLVLTWESYVHPCLGSFRSTTSLK